MKIFVDMDGVLCDYHNAWRADSVYYDTRFPQARVGFFSNLEPIKGAIEGIKRLAKKYDVYILTAPSVKNNHCWSGKAAWIEHYLGPEWLERLIITKQKGLLHDDTYHMNYDRTHLIDDDREGGGREEFFDAGDMYWFADDAADWSLVESFSVSKAFNDTKRDLELDDRITFGKFSGCVVEDVCNSDPGYVLWLIANTSTTFDWYSMSLAIKNKFKTKPKVEQRDFDYEFEKDCDRDFGLNGWDDDVPF